MSSAREEKELAALGCLPTAQLVATAEHRSRLAALIQAADPLVSFQATSLLVRVVGDPSSWPGDEDWLAAMLVPGGGVEPAPRALTNLLEACRRLLLALQDVDDDREEGGGGNGGRVGHRHHLLASISGAFPALQRQVMRLVDGGDLLHLQEEEEDEVELAVVWLLKLARALYADDGPLQFSPNAAAALCCGIWEAAGRRAIQRGLPSSCAGLVAARGQVLKLALALLDREDNEGAGLPADGVAALLRCLLEGTPATIPDVAEGIEQEGCSLVRPSRSADLLPYRLALLAKALRRMGAIAVTAAGSGSAAAAGGAEEAWGQMVRLLRCPLRLRYMAGGGAGGEEGEDESENEGEDRGGAAASGLSSPLVAALVEHDDLLFEALDDLQSLSISILTAGGGAGPSCFPLPSADAHTLLEGFVRANAPARLFAGLLEVVDEELLLEYLVSNETRALAYVVRATKFLLWQERQWEQQQQQQQRGGLGSGPVEAESMVASAEAAAFLVGLGERLRVLVRRGLFPYDIGPLLERLSELKAAVRL